MDLTLNDDVFKFFPPTHFFLYKENRFPFNIDLFKYFSKNITSICESNQPSKNINLLSEGESNIELTTETINSFIYACQTTSKLSNLINSQNVIGLDYLANKYEAEKLAKETKDYISQHQKELYLQIFSFYQSYPEISAKYEEFIADELNIYLNHEQYQSLQIPALYRIIECYFHKFGQQGFDDNPNLIQFLFKYLDTRGIKASILFEHIDFGKLNLSDQQKLLAKAPNDFDLTHLNSSFVKSTYELNNTLIQKTLALNQMENTFSQMNDEIKRMSQQIQEIATSNQQKEKDLQNKILKLNEKVESMNTAVQNVYPVGSIYMSVNETNPQQLFGGTWVPWGQGRVPVGVSPQGTFKVVEATGGSETHTLNTDELPKHGGHIPDKEHNFGPTDEDTYYINTKSITLGSFVKHACRPFVLRCSNELCLRSFEEGESKPHSILQPYITCYMWKRTK